MVSLSPSPTSTSPSPANNTITFEDALDDVHTRFLLNLPAEELASADRIFFQIEQAWWFYEDMLCDGMVEQGIACDLPRYKSLKPFAMQLFHFSPLLVEDQFSSMWLEFSNYKRTISNYGMILLNASSSPSSSSPSKDLPSVKIVLCQTWTGNSWTLPAGKINQGETGLESAARECYEETGFDPFGSVGMAKEFAEQAAAAAAGSGDGNSNSSSHPPWTIAEESISYQEANGGKRRTYYVCDGVPTDFPFSPVARKEVSQVSWFDLDNLPKRTFGILPIMGKLRRWIHTTYGDDDDNNCSSNPNNNNTAKNKKGRAKSRNKNDSSTGRPKSAGRDKSTGRDGNYNDKRTGSKQRTIQTLHDPLVNAGLAEIGDTTRWSEDDMFKANEALLGRRVEYDGNPHFFAEHGFGGIDPHAFRVVGGGFMNSSGDGLSSITNPETAKQQYQPLVRESDDTDALPLTPFFSQWGETPWGEVVPEVARGKIGGDKPTPTAYITTSIVAAPSAPSVPNPGEALLQRLQGGGEKTYVSPSPNTTTKTPRKRKTKNRSVYPSSSSAIKQGEPLVVAPAVADSEATDDAQGENDANGSLLDLFTDAQITSSSQARHGATSKQSMQEKYESDMAFIQQWVARLPNPIQFRIPNVDAIMEKHFG